MVKFVRVRAFMPDGTVMLEDGREMQAVLSSNGALGAVPRTDADRAAMLDQVVLPHDQQQVVATRPPTMKELGLDQG